MAHTPRITITAKQREQLFRYWQAVAELRAKASEIGRQISKMTGVDDGGHIIAELEAGASNVADFNMALALDGVVVSDK